MYPWWGRAEWLDSEIQSLMGSSEFEVWMDNLHNCIHIMRGGSEFTSAPFPMNEQDRDELRKAAYLLHNGLDADERQRIKEANEMVDQYNRLQKEESDAEVIDFGVWEYKNRFTGPQNKPMVIVPGGKE